MYGFADGHIEIHKTGVDRRRDVINFEAWKRSMV
jgi:hypothetical protein